MTAGALPFAGKGWSARTFYVGCYTAGTGGHGRGIEVVRHDPASGDWTVGQTIDIATGATGSDDPAAPPYLAWHPDGRHLSAVGEVADGRIRAFAVEEPGGRPAVLGSSSTGGEFPCHLVVDPHGDFVVSARTIVPAASRCTGAPRLDGPRSRAVSPRPRTGTSC